MNLIAADVLVPNHRVMDLGELESKELLINVHRDLNDMISREIFLNFLFVDLIKLLFQDIRVE